MGDHLESDVEVHGAAFVIVCDCGWRSRPSWLAEFAGSQWDEHRANGWEGSLRFAW